MAWDLWESSYDQDTQEGSDRMQSGCKCNFFSGSGLDVIEENALNEKSCIQVLRIQITKADTEIDELEQNLVSLQMELACIEDEEWHEICCKALRDKIDGLDISVRSLRNKSQNVTELQLSMPREPAEKIEDILKALLRKRFQEKDKQPPHFINVDLKADASADATELSENIEQRQLESDITVKEEFVETNTAEGRCARKNSSSKLQEKKTYCPKEIEVITEQPAHTNPMDPSPDCLRLAAGSSGKEKNLVMTESGGVITRQLDVIEQEPNSMDEKVMENESLKHEENQSLEVAQTAEASFKTSSSGSIKFSNECISMVESLSKPDMKVSQNMEVNMGVRKEHPTAADDLHPVRDEARDEASKAIVEYTSLETFIQSAAVNARSTSSESNLSTSKPANNGDYDTEEKLVKLLRKATKKEGIRESKIGKNTIKAGQVGEPEVEFQKAVAFDKSHLNSAQKSQFLMAKRKSQSDSQCNVKAVPGVGELEVEKSQKSFVAFDKSHLNFGLKPQSLRAKRKPQPDSQSSEGQGVPPPKKKYNASPLSTCNTQKDDTDDENASLNQLIFGRKPKKLTRLEPSAKEQGTLSVVVEHSLPQSLGSNRIPNLPLIAGTEELTIDLKFTDPHMHGSNGGSAGNNPNAWSLVPMCSPTRRLRDMKVPELKAIAKQHNLTSYSKLKKPDLIKFLAKQLGSQI